ncbi:MAG: hypothetical protein GYA36_12560 [Veillonellaceae bacterium]|nr:hypothetical protein [Veillonellaceae bacterium]
MRIDNLLRNSGVKPETLPVTGNEVSGQLPAKGSRNATPTMTGEPELFLTELLQRFTDLIDKRQALTEGLPASVQNRLTESVASGTADLAPATIGQGISGLVRDNRVVQASMRQVMSELDFILRNPDFAQDVASAAESGNLLFERGQSAVDAGLSALKNLLLAEQQSLSPTVLLTALIDKTVQTGIITPEFAAWAELLNAAVDQLPEDSILSMRIAMAKDSVEPQILATAHSTGQPDLVKVWAVTQALAGDDSLLTSALATAVGESSDSNGGAIGVLMQNLARENVTASMPGDLTAEPPGLASRAANFELLLSGTLSRPEVLNAFLTMLPSVAGDVSSLFALPNDKSIASIHEKLRNMAPKWLIDLSKQMNKPELVDFWIAAKATDLTPWTRLSQLEQRTALDSLKELAISYQQPEAFRESISANSNGLILQTALYMPGQEKPYPALIQIFEEKRERGGGQLPEQEVWIRITLETDHIGRVELSFRLQDKKFLTVFSRFADSAIAAEFQECLPDFEKDLANTPLELKKFAVTQQTIMVTNDG